MGAGNPAEVVTAPLGGMSVRASRWAHAAWQSMADSLEDPSSFRVIQPSFNTGVPSSAGTHDYDAVMDFQILGMTFDEASQHARRKGIANWARDPSQGDWVWHCHGFPIPPGGSAENFPVRVGIYIPGQLTDYFNHALGLADRHEPGSDPQPHPDPQFVFDYAEWLKEQDMQFSDKIPGTAVTVGTLFRQLSRQPAVLAAMRGKLNEIDSAVDALGDTASAGQLREFRLAMRDRLAEIRSSVDNLDDDTEETTP